MTCQLHIYYFELPPSGWKNMGFAATKVGFFSIHSLHIFVEALLKKPWTSYIDLFYLHW